MKGRSGIPFLTQVDTPVELAPDVEAVLEIDRLFWLDRKNRGLIQFERRLVSGEEKPYQVPDDPDRTKVVVSRLGRTFLVDGKAVLVIQDNERKIRPLKKQKQRDHKIKDAKNQFRETLAQLARDFQQTLAEGRSRVPPDLSPKARAERANKERARQAELRQQKQLKRQEIQTRKAKNSHATTNG